MSAQWQWGTLIDADLNFTSGRLADYPKGQLTYLAIDKYSDIPCAVCLSR